MKNEDYESVLNLVSDMYKILSEINYGLGLSKDKSVNEVVGDGFRKFKDKLDDLNEIILDKIDRKEKIPDNDMKRLDDLYINIVALYVLIAPTGVGYLSELLKTKLSYPSLFGSIHTKGAQN